MALNFPPSPTVGQKHPALPVVGLPSYTWDGEKWTTKADAIQGDVYVKKVGDTMTGHLSLPTGPAAANAVRKDYVDTAMAGVDLSSKVSKTGDTMSGHLSLPTSPAAANAVRKDYVDTAVAGVTSGASVAYVDSQVALKVAKTGDSMSGNLTVNGIKIGSGVDTHFYGSAGDVALRAPGSGTVYFQNQGGAVTYATANPSGLNTGYGLSVGGTATVGSTATFNGHVQHNSTTQLWADTWIPQATPGPLEIRSNTHPAIAFHAIGAFGCNFGMYSNGNFYMGGWSFGQTAFQFWTSRDFGYIPGNWVISGRMAYYGDFNYAMNTGLQEPWDGTCATGLSNNVWGDGGIVLRHRQIQRQHADGGWYSFYYA